MTPPSISGSSNFGFSSTPLCLSPLPERSAATRHGPPTHPLNVPVPRPRSRSPPGWVPCGSAQGAFFTVVSCSTPTLATSWRRSISETFKIQPADGRVIVRTTDSYMAIDPTTNSIVANWKLDVGPEANRSWAADGAADLRWPRLHRYDPATVAATGAVVELSSDCGGVYVTDELVVAWSYNEDDGESGSSAAASSIP